MAGLPHPCGSTQPLHPLGVQPEVQLIADRHVAMVVKVLLKARDALDLSCENIERLDLCQEIRRAWRRRCEPSLSKEAYPH